MGGVLRQFFFRMLVLGIVGGLWFYAHTMQSVNRDLARPFPAIEPTVAATRNQSIPRDSMRQQLLTDTRTIDSTEP
jgi:hypothetical protein